MNDIVQDQFGFRREIGIRQALFSLKILARTCKDQQKSIHMISRPRKGHRPGKPSSIAKGSSRLEFGL